MAAPALRALALGWRACGPAAALPAAAAWGRWAGAAAGFATAPSPPSSAAAAAAAADGAAQPPRHTVGFIGVGNMGLPMATCLLRAGHGVVVYDKNTAAVQELEAKGAAAAGSPREIAETPGVSAIITMLPSTEHVTDAYEGPEGVLRAARLQAPLLMDCSTISPLFTRELAERVSRARLAPQAAPRRDMLWAASGGAPRLLDAPVSGGVLAARNGALTFMVGGPADALEAAQPLLDVMGSKIIHLGGPGMGQAAKLCNNLALAVQMAGVSEAMALGEGLGLDPRKLSEVMSGSSARCWSLDSYNPVPGVMPDVPASRGYRGGFSAQLMLKDLRLVMQLASATHVPAPMAQNVSQLYRVVVDATADGAPLDFSAIYKYVHHPGPPGP